MSRIQQFKLPDLGEGLTEGEILKWLVRPGEQVRLNQPIVEVETAKAAVEVPSPYAGVVAELLHAEGETVDVGTPIIAVDTDPGGEATGAESAAGHAATAPPAPAAPATTAVATPEVDVPPEEGAVEPGLIGGPAPGGRTSVLVGYGPKSTVAKRRPRKAPASPSEVAIEQVSTSDMERPAARVSAAEVGAYAARELSDGAARALAKPPVRKLAKQLGVPLQGLSGTGPDGTITRHDVEQAAGHGAARSAPGGVGDQRIQVRGVRKHTAAAMVASAFTAPHVTEFLTVDVTRTMRLVRRLRGRPEFAGLRVGPLLLVAKALLLAAGRHPMVNSSWDEAAGEIVVRGQVNLGIAAATPRGLVVPNIKSAQSLSLVDLARALADLVETARAGRTTPADLTGGTITITNVGVFGVDTGTPILNPGEAAILAFGQIAPRPWVHKGRIRPRQVTTLGLSFDHRIVDGELGSAMLADVAAFLREPDVALLAWT